MATTTTTSTTSTPPAGAEVPQDRIRISKIASRYLVFDIDDAMTLRRAHNMCGVFGGTIPQNPQQNVFTGLPMELLAEEAAVLVARGVAHVDVGVTWPCEYFERFGAGDGVVEVSHGCVERREGSDFVDRRLPSHLRQ